jgi:hypothetical protein
LAQLEERLAALEAERAILRTLYAYGHSIDAGDEARWVDCFTADGFFAAWVTSPDDPWFRVAGRAELEAFIAEHTRPPDPAHKHLVIEPLIDVDGSNATCISYFAVLMHHDDAPLLRVFGRYHDQLAAEEDGRWRFRERVAEIQSMRPGLPALAWGRGRP